MTVSTYFSDIQFKWSSPFLFERENIKSKDGNDLFLDWIDVDNDIHKDPSHIVHNEDSEDAIPIILMIHGLGGNKENDLIF